jgi:hypothetical protein
MPCSNIQTQLFEINAEVYIDAIGSSAPSVDKFSK